MSIFLTKVSIITHLFHFKKIAKTTILVNNSFENCTFPRALKLSQIVPIFEKRNPYLTTYYKPVFMLPVISKVFEIYCQVL